MPVPSRNHPTVFLTVPQHSARFRFHELIRCVTIDRRREMSIARSPSLPTMTGRSSDSPLSVRLAGVSARVPGQGGAGRGDLAVGTLMQQPPGRDDSQRTNCGTNHVHCVEAIESSPLETGQQSTRLSAGIHRRLPPLRFRGGLAGEFAATGCHHSRLGIIVKDGPDRRSLAEPF